MREWRFLVPTVPLFLWAVGLWIAEAVQVNACKKIRVLSVAIGVATLMERGYQQKDRHSQLKRSPEFSAEFVQKNARLLKTRLENLHVKHPHLGLPDVGALALVFRSANISDVAGLGDFSIAHAKSLRAMEDYLLHEGPPLVIDAHGPSGHVAFPSLRKYFHHVGPGFNLMSGLSETEDPRCPGDKTQLLALGAPYALGKMDELWLTQDPVRFLRFWRCIDSYVGADIPQMKNARSAWAVKAASEARALHSSNALKALRYWSIAAVLGDNPKFRKWAEIQRNRLFPASPDDSR